MKTAVKKIITDEFSKLVRVIESDFSSNYRRKINNFLLSQMDRRTVANMVFVSSFESKSGFSIEACAKKIAQLTFGAENVPEIVNPRNLPYDFTPGKGGGQKIVTDVDIHSGDLQGEIAAFRAKNNASGRGHARTESRVTHESCRQFLLPMASKYKTNKLFTKPVDLAFFDGSCWNIMELKAGGDLDSSNAPSNVEKLLTIYTGMGIENCKAYFATLYNKDGEGNVWSGGVKKHLNYPSMFLIGGHFWERILPPGITFNDFTAIYLEALRDIDLSGRMNRMINKCLGE